VYFDALRLKISDDTYRSGWAWQNPMRDTDHDGLNITSFYDANAHDRNQCLAIMNRCFTKA